VIFIVVLFFVALGRDYQKPASAGLGQLVGDQILDWASDYICRLFSPSFSFVKQENKELIQLYAGGQMRQVLPLYQFVQQNIKMAVSQEDTATIEMILLAEAEDEEGHGSENIPDRDDLTALFAEENQAAAAATSETNEVTDIEAVNEGINDSVNTAATAFVPRQKVDTLDLATLSDYETLVKSLYTIDSSTMIGSDQLNAKLLSSKKLSIAKDPEVPQILIFHTHYNEAFADSTLGDSSTGIVGVGEKLKDILEQDYGYQVIHYTGQYDMQAGPDAYSGALPIIEQILEDNPSIQVVLDLHRDAAGEGDHLVMDLDGRSTAQFMFFNGLSRTRKTGNIAYLYNENLDSNLAFSFQMQTKVLEYYPGLTRKIYLKAYRYNMHLSPRYALVEMGAQNNTLEEVMNACYPLAHILDLVLSGES
jgi:stage II sporulation protein P